jgi:acyl-CoA synthetase (AMP-forming)/AMP-acid ligase II
VERRPAENKRAEFTWREFDARASKLARALIRRGVNPGDKVALLLTNCLDWLPIYFGILRAGALAVPLNFRFEADTILRCIETAESAVLIFGEEFIDRIHRVKPALDKTVKTYIFTGAESQKPPGALSYRDLLAAEPPQDPAVAIKISADAALYFTSGTTGSPKAALLTHRNLEFAGRLENQHHHQTRSDNFLCLPPLYHTGAKMHWFGNFIVGAPAVILKDISPRWILEAISEEKITIVWLLVPWTVDILTAIENGQLQLKDYCLDQWRLMHIGAQPVPPSLIRKWKTVFPQHQYDTNYGLTEASGPGCLHLGIENSHKVGAIGRAGFGWKLKIVDGQRQPVAQGQTGELAVKGPGVMKAYYQNPQATNDTLVDGWLLTGDMVRQDEDGFVWLVDRKKDIIITGGENIYPVEIEDFLQEHPAVRDAAVIGLPDPRLGEIAAAVIQLKPGLNVTAEEILNFCRKLPRYKQPRRIIFGEVPRNPTGKIEKPRLRKAYAQKL